MRILAVKKITVAELPECLAKGQLISFVTDPFTVEVNVVAVQGVIDWACYIGFPSSLYDISVDHRSRNIAYYVMNVSSPEQVAEVGDKLEEEVAKKLFPDLARNFRYRR